MIVCYEQNELGKEVAELFYHMWDASVTHDSATLIYRFSPRSRSTSSLHRKMPTDYLARRTPTSLRIPRNIAGARAGTAAAAALATSSSPQPCYSPGYFLFQPRLPDYFVESLSARGLDLSLLRNQTLLLEFDATVRAENPNEKIRMFFSGRGSITVACAEVELAKGVLPELYLAKENMTSDKME
ncbi:hypothetical protein ACLOJK_000180 [Asimina triloba]